MSNVSKISIGDQVYDINDKRLYIVKFSYSESIGDYICNKTIDEIYNVINEGKQLIIGVYDNQTQTIMNLTDIYSTTTGKGFSFSIAQCVLAEDDTGERVC